MNKILPFGSYPQTLVTDEKLVSQILDFAFLELKLNNVDILSKFKKYKLYEEDFDYWYYDIKYHDKNYRCVYFKENKCKDIEKSFQVENGYLPNNFYLFEFETIIWMLINITDFDAKLISNVVLDEYIFNIVNEFYEINGQGGQESSNYRHALIRKWLNVDFYHDAFNRREKKFIRNIELQGTNTYSIPYEMPNVCDDVYLLTDKEYCKIPLESNICKTASDYAKCMGVKMIDGYPSFWLRTEAGATEEVVICNGNKFESDVECVGIGVAPVITLRYR